MLPLRTEGCGNLSYVQCLTTPARKQLLDFEVNVLLLIKFSPSIFLYGLRSRSTKGYLLGLPP